MRGILMEELWDKRMLTLQAATHLCIKNNMKLTVRGFSKYYDMLSKDVDNPHVLAEKIVENLLQDNE